MPRGRDRRTTHLVALLRPGVPAALTHDALGELAVGGVGHQLEHGLLERLLTEFLLGLCPVVQQRLVGAAKQTRRRAVLKAQGAPKVPDLAHHARTQLQRQPDFGSH